MIKGGRESKEVSHIAHLKGKDMEMYGKEYDGLHKIILMTGFVLVFKIADGLLV